MAAKYVLAFGDAASALMEAADEKDAKMIVVGARGHGGSERMLPGSVGRELVAHAKTDVLVVQ